MPNNISYISIGTGEVILFLHGWGQNKEMMLPLIDELKYKYRCIILDLPGFGNSIFNNSKNIDDYTEKIKEFLTENKLFPKYIVGHSFGGKIAIQYYLKYKNISKIIIIASPVLKPKRRFKYYYKIYKYKLMKKFRIRSLKKGSRDYNNCPNEMKRFFINVVNKHYNKDVKNINVPVLLLWGNKDKEVPINRAKKLNKKINNSELHILDGTHFAYLENIEFTKLIIQKFLRGK